MLQITEQLTLMLESAPETVLGLAELVTNVETDLAEAERFEGEVYEY